MSLPLRSEVHVGSPRRNLSRPAGAMPAAAPSQGTGVSAPLVAASQLQAVYACQPTDSILGVVCLDRATRTCRTADASQNAPVLGIIQSKPSAQTALVVTLGPVDGFTQLTPGARYFLATDGALCCPPLVPAQTPYIHPVGVAVTDTQLFVMPQWPILKRASDDDLQSP